MDSFTIPQGITTIEARTFSGCDKLTNITIPNSVEKIGAGAFESCGFKSIIIPENVKSIGYQAFVWCRELLSITLPNSLVEISEYAFDECKSIEAVSAPAFVFPHIPKLKLKTAIVTCGETLSGFNGAQNLENITLCDTIISMDVDSFSGCNLLRYNTKNNMNYLGSKTNPYLVAIHPTSTSLTSLAIDENSKIIYNQCFNYCTNLKSITIPDNIIEIGIGTFKGCNSLESIELPFIGIKAALNNNDEQYPLGCIFGTVEYAGGVATIQYLKDSYGYTRSTTFYIPTSLKKVSINGTKIPYGAFYNCKNIINIYIGNTINIVENDVFVGCESLQYNIKDDIKYLGNLLNPYILAVKGISSNATEIILDNNCKIIYDSAFYNYTKVKQILLPNSVEKIGSSAFSYCSALEEITIGEQVSSIGSYAFYNCNKLTKVVLSNTAGWKTNKNITIPEESLSNFLSAANCLTSTYLGYSWIRS